jgi:hypothetical protein
VDRKGVGGVYVASYSGIEQADDSDVTSGTDGYKMVSQLYLWQSGDTIHKRSIEVRRIEKLCSVSINGRNFPPRKKK